MVASGPIVNQVTAQAFCIPTDAPEADGTISWDSTTVVVVTASAAGQSGLGYTYSAASVPAIVIDVLAPLVVGKDAFSIPKHWAEMVRAVRNIGWRGLCATAISAVDTALWDLKARILDLPLASLFGCERLEVPIYGSGGFTSYSDERVRDQLAAWVEQDGCRFVKMKIGTHPADDLSRIRVARQAIGDAELFVDANGAFSRKQALWFAERFPTFGISWFEEPVSSDDLEGLRLLRDRAPPGIDIAAGEYGYEPFYFRRMIEAGAVDVLQADVTRCCGFTGFMRAAALCDAYALPLSCHCAPALHLHAACAVPRLRHLEWFHDHVRIEHMLFDGAPVPSGGVIRADLTRPGHGLVFKSADAERFLLRPAGESP
ncbi:MULTISPECIES: enolase C-terminal domain-like protein [unclassified Mesorhizobium]|uniref:enolase C-terminal domain-like protein n=1 Tax=unclassified Mesorhizobium TaxID=325217 RepID=UPI001128065A|nr:MULTISPECIES: enolase C-terminal domain-like protein [unclassified Mesorhizobium]MBZ9701652.1 mandelate racemase [Mesorhizobium sp. CO1-1-3]MBZ9948999.1 mandelate racemase [Mesorhizobium sp. BR1-1-11]TPI99544.1 mandelate racemase [Mesorhizobium sp. B2-8-1]